MSRMLIQTANGTRKIRGRAVVLRRNPERRAFIVQNCGSVGTALLHFGPKRVKSCLVLLPGDSVSFGFERFSLLFQGEVRAWPANRRKPATLSFAEYEFRKGERLPS